MAAEIALHHHEKWDGSGYPAGRDRRGDPEASRIVAIADVFDALSVRRPYKSPGPGPGAGYHARWCRPALPIPGCSPFSRIMPEILRLKAQWDAREERGLPDGLCQIGIAGPFVTKGGARAMARNKDDLIPERQQGLGNRPDQRPVIPAREIGAAYAAGKEHIPTQARRSAWQSSTMWPGCGRAENRPPARICQPVPCHPLFEPAIGG